MDPILERYQALEDKIKEYNPALDAQRLFRAFTYADNAHAGQLRKDGSPYITHPLAVAEIVAELELDTDSIIAALLHDCIEDTDATHEEIAKKFGASVAELVEGLRAKIRSMNDAMGIPNTLKDFGIIEDEFKEKLDAIAANAVGDACTGSNPRPIDPATMAKLFTCIYYGTEVDF